jgi:hypothetical protein
VPLVSRYDHHERTFGPMLPHLFQRRTRGHRNEVISTTTVQKLRLRRSRSTSWSGEQLTGPAAIVPTYSILACFVDISRMRLHEELATSLRPSSVPPMKQASMANASSNHDRPVTRALT